MDQDARSLQLIVFTVAEEQVITLLDDVINHNPGYQVGDVIQLLELPEATNAAPQHNQYVIDSVKNVIVRNHASVAAQRVDYLLLVKVTKLCVHELEPPVVFPRRP